MKAITLHQPWATAIAYRLKLWETRSWPTQYRGDIAIHAAKTIPPYAKEFLYERGTQVALRVDGAYLYPELTLGKIVAVALLTDCRPTEDVVAAMSERERLFGNYAPGRFAWHFENIRRLTQPVLCRGYQQLWAVPGDVVHAIQTQELR